MKIEQEFDHDELGQVKIRVTLDGDLAATLSNFVIFMGEHGFIEEYAMCEHVYPKLEEFMDNINQRLKFEKEKEQ